MSDSDFAKKMMENEDLSVFIIAYQRVTGYKLTIADPGECPDFICVDAGGRRIGIELTKVYASTHTERTLEGFREAFELEPVTGYDLCWGIDEAAYHKSEKVRNGSWRFKRNMLVLQVYECPLDEVAPCLDDLVDDIVSNSVFQQIWVAGFYEQDAYSEIDLYCIKPARFRGYHSRPFEKPYG
ncbi:MAG TPA: hypothetical protein VJ464_01370 [Blastocatellia bacterium]|nr:hypothetical protein [Blastocatellia bacterium]